MVSLVDINLDETTKSFTIEVMKLPLDHTQRENANLTLRLEPCVISRVTLKSDNTSFSNTHFRTICL